jgi:DNA excision repair protein ERCC-2
LAFLSSFDYLERLAAQIRLRHPVVPLWMQAPGMDEAAREAFLARFRTTDRGIGLSAIS